MADKIVPPAAGRGRPKGAQNKVTRTAKEMIEQAALGLGGVEGMIAWAKSDPDNLKAFWSQVFPKLMPHQVNMTAEHSGGIVITWQREPS